MKNKLIIGIFFLTLYACENKNKVQNSDALFEKMPSDQTNISFVNKLTYDKEFNIYTYRNFYNGGGVAIGDINNDGLSDIYFSANMSPNKLYLNKGDFKFEDISEKAGVTGHRKWSTGVTMADVNGDGWLDIYVCNSGDVKGDNKQNELFINNHDGTFTEKAEEMGLADQGYSTHAAFFDYDHDGDLDMYLLNNSYQAIGSFNLKQKMRDIRDEKGGDKLFRNDDNHFVDVSSQAGIYGSVIGFGLGVTVGDINMDGWSDIYVSNDFFERDYLYINNGDGTFKEQLTSEIRSLSAASMGADLADVNNDLFPDLFVTEMLPEKDARLKTKTTFEDYDKVKYNIKNDYYYQYTRNMLHLNQQGMSFDEIGRFAGVEATDWSWGALLADFDNDGFRDIFVSNGIYQDLTDQDFLNFIANEETMKSVITEKGVDYKKLIDAIPSEKIPNYFFKNINGDRFENHTDMAGLFEPSHSNGSSYGDLDNDGDLDLVVNNVNMPSFVYRNNTVSKDSSAHYIQYKLNGRGKNQFAIGSKVFAYSGKNKYYAELIPFKGFESTMDYIVHLGLGNTLKLDSVVIVWPNNLATRLMNPIVNKRYEVMQPETGIPFDYESLKIKANNLVINVKDIKGLDYKHVENEFVDFDRDRLLYHMMSTMGPALAIADYNGDGLDDIYAGGAKDQVASLYFQNSDGAFKKQVTKTFNDDAICEDVSALAFDINGDNHKDLYVCSGGNEFSAESSGLKDRLYINDGRGNFTKSQDLNAKYSSNTAVTSCDFDNDGDNDLFVGERVKMFQYGVPCSGQLLKNENGKFKDVTSELVPELMNCGMITSAAWADVDGNRQKDLIVVGEYMPIKIFLNNNGKFTNGSNLLPPKTEGWWNTIEAADIDKDGKIDIVLGNHGLNSRFKASSERPMCMHVNDFDKNGSVEQVICKFEGDKSYPMVLKHDLVEQLPFLKKKYLMYSKFKNQTIDDLFTPESKAGMITLNAYMLESVVLHNTGNGFKIIPLPDEAQMSPIYDIYIDDLNNDGKLDIIAGGNLYSTKPEIGRYDDSRGIVLLGNGDCTFTPLPYYQSGLNVEGEIRHIDKIKIKGIEELIFARNNDALQFYKLAN